MKLIAAVLSFMMIFSSIALGQNTPSFLQGPAEAVDNSAFTIPEGANSYRRIDGTTPPLVLVVPEGVNFLVIVPNRGFSIRKGEHFSSTDLAECFNVTNIDNSCPVVFRTGTNNTNNANRDPRKIKVTQGEKYSILPVSFSFTYYFIE